MADFCGQWGAPVQNQVQAAQGQGQPLQDQSSVCKNSGTTCAEPDAARENPYPSVPGQRPMQYQNAVSTAETAAPVKGRHKKTGIIVGIAATAAAVVAAIVFGVSALLGGGGRGYEETIAQFVNSLWSGDLDSYLDVLPDGSTDVIMSEEGLDREDLEIMMKNTPYDFPVTGPGHEPIFEIAGIENCSELKQVQEIYKSQLDLDVSKVRICAVNISFKNSSESDSMEGLALVKIGNS